MPVLCTRHAVPAFVMGFELPAESVRALVERLAPRMPSFVTLHQHQCGGYSCQQVWLLGVTLRFEANEDKARGRVPLGALRQGLIALGEFGSSEVSTRALHPEVAWMSDLTPTSGQSYDAQDLKLLQETIADAVPGLPPIEDAIEAFVRFRPESTAALLHWRMFTLAPGAPAEINDWDFAEAPFSEDVEWTEQRAEELKALGQSAGLGPVRTFLLWENSD